MVEYRDSYVNSGGERGDIPHLLDLDFSTDKNAIIAAINSLTAAGGGDPDETVFGGLMMAIQSPWRNDAEKAILLIGDGLPHDPERVDGEYTHSSVIAAANAVSPGVGSTPARPVHIYPVAITTFTQLRPAFQLLADGTNGTLFEATTTGEVSSAMLAAMDAAVHAPAALASTSSVAQIGSPVTFDALASYDTNTVIARYEWDFDGDGVFDRISADPITTYTYPAAFNGLATLRVTNDGGYTTSALIPITVGTGPNPSPTRNRN